jgi:hypothetical protein
MSKIAGLPDSCLDATLGYVHFTDLYIKAFLSGDGAIIGKKRDGTIWASIINYDVGAPPYLSYGLDEKRRNLFLDKTNGCKHTIEVYSGEKNNVLELISQEDTQGMEPHYFLFEQDEYELVMVVSDGISSFQRPISDVGYKYYQQVPATEIVPHLTAIKSPTGSFMKRRCKRLIKDLCIRGGWKHLDDLSVAAIYCEGK